MLGLITAVLVVGVVSLVSFLIPSGEKVDFYSQSFEN